MRNPLVGTSRRAVAAVLVALAVLTGIGVAYATRSPGSASRAQESPAPSPGPSGPANVASSADPGAAAGSSEGSISPSPSSGSTSVSPGESASPSSSPTSSQSPAASASGSPSAAPSGSAAPAGAVIEPEFFGLHIHSPASSWPTVPFGSTRLWDSDVTWKQLQPSRSRWNFDRLDAQVAQANARHKDIIMVLGVTPQWASARPGERANYGSGSAAEPRQLADWTTYVRTLAQRYRGRITKWELWNEPNAVLFWSGTAADMVPLARAAYGVLKATDPRNVVLSPGIIVRTLNSPLWLDEYLAAGGGQYADVIAAHFYVKTFERPEHLRPSMERIQAIMAAHGVADKPLWNTESSFGQTSVPTDLITEPLASAYVARALALFAGQHIRRTYWYAWDDHSYTGLYLTRRSGAVTEAGRVFGLMSSWLVGARPRTCERLAAGKSEGAFVCYFSRGADELQIVWHPGKTAQYDVPAGFRTVRRLDGSSASLTGSAVAVTPVPVLITTAAS